MSSAALRQAVLDECLKVARLACSIFDATEADAISPATARELIEMNQAVHDIHAGLVTLATVRW